MRQEKQESLSEANIKEEVVSTLETLTKLVKVKGRKIITTNFIVPILIELKRERGRTHQWMQIVKSKGVEDLALMEEKTKKWAKRWLV